MSRSLLVLCVILLASTLRAQAISSEIPIIEPRVDAPAGVNPGGWAIAASGDSAYLIWNDVPNIYGVQLAPNGEPLLDTRTYLGNGYFGVDDAVAARDACYAVWHDGLGALHIRRSDGAEDAVISDFVLFPRLRWNGSHFLLIYNQDSHLYGLLLDPHLQRTVRSPFTITDTAASVSPAVASAAGDFLVVWNGRDGTTHLARVDDGGTVTPSEASLPGVPTYLSISTSGMDYLIAWRSGIYGDGATAARVNVTGAIASEILTIEPTGSHVNGNPSIVWTGASYLVAWPVLDISAPIPTALKARSVTSTAIGDRQTIDVGPLSDPHLAGDGNAPSIAWLSGFGSSPALIGHRLGDSQRHLISRGATNQRSPAIAGDGFESAVVWVDGQRLLIGRIRFDGTQLDPGGIPVADLTALTSPPRVAFDGVNYLVLWGAWGHIFGRFFSPAGELLSNSFQVSGSGQTQAADVAWLGYEYFAAWGGPAAGAAIISLTGSVTATDLFPHFQTIGEVAVARAGAGAAVIAYTTYPSESSSTMSTILWHGGAVATPTVVISPLGSPPNYPRIASSGSDFLLGWSHLSGVTSTTYIARLDQNGVRAADPVAVNSFFGSPRQSEASIALLFDGSHYQVISTGNSLQHAVVTDDTFACHCLVTHEVPVQFEPTNFSPFFGGIAAAPSRQEKIVIGYDRSVVNSMVATRERVFLRIIDTAVPRRRHVARR
jgi:hypothetical protein